jgi:PPOX class probable F420-dependent enzyme
MSIIPENFRDLLDRPVIVTLATILPNGYPHATPVWCSYDGEHILINTIVGRQKDKDMSRHPKIAVAAFDPDDPYRWMEVRGTVVDQTLEGAVEHIEALAWQYKDMPFYGGYAAAERRHTEQRIIYKILPEKVTHSK